MRFLAKLTPVAAAAALVLSGCGGGGGGATSPHPVTPASAPPSTTSSHTAVGTARLTLVLPKVVRAKNGTSVVRAIPHGAARATAKSGTRMPKYINPSPNPGQPPCNGNILDIYVNGVLVPAIDGGPEAPDSWCVTQTSDSSQLVNVPLYSVQSNEIVVVEWDSILSNVLAIGETDYGPYSPGSAVNLNLTMQMNAEWIGITDLGFANPVLMQGGSWSTLTCPGTAQFAVYTADALGVFVPIAGYNGTSTPSVTGSPISGTTSLPQSAIPGIYSVAWDGSCDGLNVSATAQNPAYAIWFDAFESYGSYPGIQYLYQYDINSFDNAFSQLSTSSVNGSIQVLNGG